MKILVILHLGRYRWKDFNDGKNLILILKIGESGSIFQSFSASTSIPLSTRNSKIFTGVQQLTINN